MSETISLMELNHCSYDSFVQYLSGIFEHSDWVAELAFEQRPFSSLKALLETMVQLVQQADDRRQTALIQAHPKLGSKKKMTSHSTHEQQSAGLNELNESEQLELQALNDAYEEKFDFPFIFAVKGKSKKDILASIKLRFPLTKEEEKRTALNEIFKIATFRFHDRFLLDKAQ